MPEVEAVIVGSKHYAGALDALRKMRVGEPVRLEREPEHEKDRNAVACWFLAIKVGFISRLANPRIAAAMDAGAIPIAIVQRAPVVRGKGFVQTEPMLRIAWRD